MTTEQDALIERFKELSAAANSIDGCDIANADRLTALMEQLKELARKIQATGLQMNALGEWVTPNDQTYDYAA